MNFIDIAIYIIGSLLTGGLLIYPIAYRKGRLDQLKRLAKS